MNKKEINYKGYRVVIPEDVELTQGMIFILDKIEEYAFVQERALKVVFFNYDDNGQEAGLSYFFRKEYAQTE